MPLADTFSILWDLLKSLSAAPDGLSAGDICRKYEISRGAANKYLHILETAGIPLYYDRKRYYVDPGFSAPFDLTAEESEFLYLMLERSVLFHTHRWPTLQSVLRKLERKMPFNLGERLTAGLNRLPHDSDLWFKHLVAAKRDRREVRVTYHPLHRDPGSWLIRPFRFTGNAFSDGLYVLCEGTRNGTEYIPLSLKFDRILDVQPTDTRFDIAALTRFALQDGSAWGVWHSQQKPVPVTLRFEPRHYDRLLETTWHQTQSITTDPDDYITFTVQVAEPEEMIPWIRSWGSGVVVLEPESLRQRMIATLQRQLQAYGLPAGEVSRKSRRACLWAKYDRQSEFYHRLEYHLLDVAAVAWQMWERALSPAWRHRVATLLGLDHEAARCLIALLAGLHDIGKATPEFQRKAPPLYEALLAAGLPDRHEGDVAHGILSAVIINSLLLAKPGVDERAGQVVSAAVGGHHGEFVDFKQFRMRRSTLLREGWSEIHTELCNMLERVLQVTAFRFPEEPAEYNVFAGWLAGFVSVCDWIGSHDGYFPYETLDIDENRYFARALGQAELALTEMGWFGWSKPHDLPDFQTLFPFPPNLFQQTALEFCVDTAAPAAPRLVLIEYLTGGGKTELALYLADWLANAFDQAGTYIAMPTRATSNQMFERVSQYLQTRYPHQPINVQLIHAQADQHPLYQQLLPRPEREGDDNRLKAESWFQNRRRALLAPFAVGTIDQAMLGVLPVQHYFVRQFALTHKTVIFDEIHAYDTYMNVIIERLLQWLNALSSSVILLSATLPAATRQRLIEQAAPGQTLPVVPYPRLTLVDQAGHVRVHRLPAPPPRELALAYLDPQVAALVELLLPIYQAGGCIAVICNTVDEAVQVAYVLQQHAAISAQDLLVFHARFPAAWRAPIEQEVLRRFSKHGERPARAILVATQIVEQSLDLDFDLMVTRVAPMDLLIQRAGRLHRHAGRSRPEHLQQPALVIRMPDFDEAQVPLFGVDEVVYQRLILLKTWLALHDRDRLRLPEDIDTLMEAVYGEDDIPNLTAPWAAALKTAHETMKLSETRSGFRASQKCISTPDDEMALWNTAAAFRDDEADVVTTRDMLPGVDILCLGTAGNRQGLPTLPAHRPAREETAHLLRFVLTVHKAGVREALVKLPVPDGWQRIPQLQHVRPVTFVDGLYHIAGTSWTLRLTRTYGLEIVEDRD